MDLLDLEELDDLKDILHGRLANFSNVARLLDGFFYADQVALVLILTHHARLKLVHLHFELLPRFQKCVSQEVLLA